MKFHFI